MDHSIAPQTHVFKLNCPKCQKKVKKLLSRLNGVYSIKVDADAGRVTIKSTVNPDTLAAAVGGIMKERDSSCEPLTPPPNNNVHVEQWINNVPVPTADNGNAHYKNQFKGYEGADLHELARAPRVKQLEFTQTRNIKMIFNDEKENGRSRPTSEPKKDAGPNIFMLVIPVSVILILTPNMKLGLLDLQQSPRKILAQIISQLVIPVKVILVLTPIMSPGKAVAQVIITLLLPVSVMS